jgi:hypothetical protein
VDGDVDVDAAVSQGEKRVRFSSGEGLSSSSSSSSIIMSDGNYRVERDRDVLPPNAARGSSDSAVHVASTGDKARKVGSTSSSSSGSSGSGRATSATAAGTPRRPSQPPERCLTITLNNADETTVFSLPIRDPTQHDLTCAVKLSFLIHHAGAASSSSSSSSGSSSSGSSSSGGDGYHNGGDDVDNSKTCLGKKLIPTYNKILNTRNKRCSKKNRLFGTNRPY